jgi:hypothetical protein
MFVDRAGARGQNWEGVVQDGTMIYLAQEPSPGVGLPQCQASHRTPEISPANGISILPPGNRLTNGACTGADLPLFEIWMFPEPEVPGSAI